MSDRSRHFQDNGDLQLCIPVEFVNQRGLTLTEKVALTLIDDDSFVSNEELGRVLSLSKTGVEALIRRLKRRGLVVQFRKGRARELNLKMCLVEPLTE